MEKVDVISNNMIKAIDSIAKDINHYGWSVEMSTDVHNIHYGLGRALTGFKNLIVITDNFIVKRGRIRDEGNKSKLAIVGTLNKELSFNNASPAKIGSSVYEDGDYYVVFTKHHFAGPNYPLKYHKDKIKHIIDFKGRLIRE